MSNPMTLPDSRVLTDQFVQILKICQTHEVEPSSLHQQLRTMSLKLDLRAIQEVEALGAEGAEEDFDDLLFAPKVREFLTKNDHNEQDMRAFWLLIRIRYLSLLSRPKRAEAIQMGDQSMSNPVSLLTEFFKLAMVRDRIRLLSRLPYRDFAALILETDKRNLSLAADGGAFLISIAFRQQNHEARKSARRTFLAR